MTSRPINNQEYICRIAEKWVPGMDTGLRWVSWDSVTITRSVAPNAGHCPGRVFRIPGPEASEEVRWGAQADLRQEEAHADLQGGHQAHLQAGSHVNWYQGVHNLGKF